MAQAAVNLDIQVLLRVNGEMLGSGLPDLAPILASVQCYEFKRE